MFFLKLKFLWAFISLLLFIEPIFAFDTVLELSPEMYSQEVLKSSLEIQQIKTKYEEIDFSLYQVLSNYDWKLTAETGYENDRLKTLSSFNEFKYERYKTGVFLSKSFDSGLLATLEANYVQQKADASILTSQGSFAVPSPLHWEEMGLTLEQPLWKNSFGAFDKAILDSAETLAKANKSLEKNEQQDLVLHSLRQYWSTYISYANWVEAKETRDRYKKLVESVRKKASYSYSSPGELSQIMAEYQVREQLVHTTEIEYYQYLEQFLVLIKKPLHTKIVFKIDRDTFPPAPIIPQKTDVQGTRAYRAQKLRVKSAESALAASAQKDRDSLAIVGKAYSAGVNSSSSESFSELSQLSHPKYYVGLKYEHLFGGDAFSQDKKNKLLELKLEENKLERKTSELESVLNQAERRINATFEVLQNIKQQQMYREKTVEELQKSFRQGRSDISFLIDALNKSSATKVQYLRALGDYYISQKDLAGLRDELIK